MFSLVNIGRRAGSLLLVGSLSVFGVMGLGGSVEASPCGTLGGLDTTDVSITLGGTVNSNDCFGIISGNDTGNNGTGLSNLNLSLFGDEYKDDWELFGKSDDGSNTVTADNDEPSGAFSINFAPSAYSIFAVSLKAGSEGYAMYLFDLSPDAIQGADGSFSMFINSNSGNQIDLSHLTVWTFGTSVPCPNPDPITGVCEDDPGVDPVPLPAGLPLMMTVLGVGAYMRKRARKAA